MAFEHRPTTATLLILNHFYLTCRPFLCFHCGEGEILLPSIFQGNSCLRASTSSTLPFHKEQWLNRTLNCPIRVNQFLKVLWDILRDVFLFVQIVVNNCCIGCVHFYWQIRNVLDKMAQYWWLMSYKFQFLKSHLKQCF